MTRPLFSDRYGVRDEGDGNGEHWTVRHTIGEHSDCEPVGLFRCTCPGPGRRHPCCARATAEDRFCTECRDYCYGVDRSGRRWTLRDMHGVSA